MVSGVFFPRLEFSEDMELKDHSTTISVGPATQVFDDGPIKNTMERNLCCPSCLACTVSCIIPCYWCSGCMTVNEKTETVLLNYGKFEGVLREPGCYCYNPAGTTAITISLKQQAVDLKDVKVADARGNPIKISGVVTYYIVNSRKAALEVDYVNGFLATQGLAVMKQIAALYPYEAKEGLPSLKTEASHIKQQMIAELQTRVTPAGIRVLNFELTDLAYAPEVAQGMLIRQMAEAKLDARKTIVEGAVEIAKGAVAALSDSGIRMNDADQARLISNLLITICSDASVQPTLSVSE